MTTVNVNGIAVAYDEAGSGERVVLFVHGHPFNRSMWRPQMSAVSSAGWRAVAPDLRGYGDTTVVPGKTTLDVFADDLAGLLDALGVVQCVAVGLSMGGQIVMELARRHRSRLAGLVLAATFPQADTEEGAERRRQMANRLLSEGMDAYAEEVLPKMIAPQSIATLPDVARHVSTMMRGTDPRGAAAALLGRAERPSYESVLADFDAPALIVVGDQDAFTTRADAERMHRLLKRSTLVWVHGVGHMPNLERPDEFNTALTRFLDASTNADAGMKSSSLA